jgi:flagellar hook-associated protein 3 FlgL
VAEEIRQMNFRVTQSQMAATARNYLAKQSSELFTTQQQISTGLRIQRPSDDPAAIRRSLIQKDRVERLEAHEVSISHVKSTARAGSCASEGYQ